jgi:hypothetical protein
VGYVGIGQRALRQFPDGKDTEDAEPLIKGSGFERNIVEHGEVGVPHLRGCFRGRSGA